MGRRRGSVNKPKNQGPGGANLKPGEPNPPWNPAPPQKVETVSMFLECSLCGKMNYRNEDCKNCGASSAMG